MGMGVRRGCLSSDLDEVESAALPFPFGDDALVVPGEVVRGAASLVGLCFASAGPGPLS